MTKSNPKSERIYIRLTPALHERLKQMMVSQGFTSLSDTGREAIRYYLDNMSEQIGSRRHFSRSMQKEIAATQDFVHMHSAIQTYMLAHFLASMLTMQEQLVASNGHNGHPARVWKGSDLLTEATRIAMHQQPALRLTIEKMQELARKQQQEIDSKQMTGES
jgi:Arc/MetJ-type ribon-helix-helix transcriptional regulator